MIFWFLLKLKKKDIYKRLKNRPGFNPSLLNKFRKIQINSNHKKKTSHYIIKNDFTKKSVKSGIKSILNKIL